MERIGRNGQEHDAKEQNPNRRADAAARFAHRRHLSGRYGADDARRPVYETCAYDSKKMTAGMLAAYLLR